jgi:hypothetical protein
MLKRTRTGKVPPKIPAPSHFSGNCRNPNPGRDLRRLIQPLVNRLTPGPRWGPTPHKNPPAERLPGRWILRASVPLCEAPAQRLERPEHGMSAEEGVRFAYLDIPAWLFIPLLCPAYSQPAASLPSHFVSFPVPASRIPRTAAEELLHRQRKSRPYPPLRRSPIIAGGGFGRTPSRTPPLRLAVQSPQAAADGNPLSGPLKKTGS